MSRTNFFFVLIFLAGCKSVTAPKHHVPARKAIHTEAYGGWLSVTTPTGKINGELLAATSDSIYIMTRIIEGRRKIPNLFDKTKVIAASKSDISAARLVIFNTNSGSFELWTGLGALSTISHGVLLVFTAPLWIIVGATNAGIEGKRPNYLDYPATTWKEIEMFARFPQGIPEGVDVRTLKGR
jgi:hypothetical protein